MAQTVTGPGAGPGPGSGKDNNKDKKSEDDEYTIDLGGGSGTRSGGSSGFGSSGNGGYAGDPVEMQKMQAFASIFMRLWGEPATQEYLKAAAQAYSTTWEFEAAERAKPAFAKTKTYHDEGMAVAENLKRIVGYNIYAAPKGKGGGKEPPAHHPDWVPNPSELGGGRPPLKNPPVTDQNGPPGGRGPIKEPPVTDGASPPEDEKKKKRPPAMIPQGGPR